MAPEDGPERESEAPDALRRDLQALFAPEVEVPATVDRAVMVTARRRLSRPRPVLRLVRRVAAAAALVAVVLLVRMFANLGERADGRTPTRSASVAALDFDRDGRVDVLDAFALARRVERGEPLATRWDLNGDGKIDRRDADVIARRAVAIGGERR
jgi:hypothetical protein